MFLTCFIEQKVWSLLSFWSLFSFGQLHFVGFFSHLQVFFPPFVLHSHSKNRLSIYALTNKLIQSCREKSSHQPWNLSAYCPVCFIQLLIFLYMYIFMCTYIWYIYKNIKYVFAFFFLKLLLEVHDSSVSLITFWFHILKKDINFSFALYIWISWFLFFF